jgi:hypothetical protein
MRECDRSPQVATPPLTWRIASTTTIAIVGILSKAFLNIANSTTVHGLDGFVKILDERIDPSKRDRGLITGEYNPTTFSGALELMTLCKVSNHVSVSVPYLVSC